MFGVEGFCSIKPVPDGAAEDEILGQVGAFADIVGFLGDEKAVPALAAIVARSPSGARPESKSSMMLRLSSRLPPARSSSVQGVRPKAAGDQALSRSSASSPKPAATFLPAQVNSSIPQSSPVFP